MSIPRAATINAIYRRHAERGTTPKKSVFALLPNELIMDIIKLAYKMGTLDYHTARVGLGNIGGSFNTLPWIWTRCSGRSVRNPLRGVVIEFYERTNAYLPTTLLTGHDHYGEYKSWSVNPVPARDILALVKPNDFDDITDTDSDSDDDDY